MGIVTGTGDSNSEEAMPIRKRAITTTSCHDNEMPICNCHSKFSNHVSFDGKDDLSNNSYVYIYNYLLKYVFTTFKIERQSFGVFR
jgi:hypothetical protein